MRNLAELNLNEGGKQVERHAPTVETIDEFKTKYDIDLPDKYIQLLQFSNGGHPELDSIEPIGRPGTARWAVNRFYHLDKDKSSTASLWVAMEKWQHILGKDAVPFATDGGGNQFFLDLKKSPASVKVCVHDDNLSIVEIAPSFEAFIDGLSVDPDMI